MNQQAEDAITQMLNCFPQTNQDYDVLLDSLARLLHGLNPLAIIEAADRFARGDVAGQSKKFAPSAPEFVQEARKIDEVLSIKAKPRLPAPKYRPGPLAPFEIAKQKALSANAHLPVLFEDISYDEFRRLSLMKQIPIGAKWVSATATVYGPDPNAKREAA